MGFLQNLQARSEADRFPQPPSKFIAHNRITSRRCVIYGSIHLNKYDVIRYANFY
jgi:hypothetical protein